MNLITSKYIEIDFLQKKLIDAKYDGDLSNESLKVWWQILAEWRAKNERDNAEKTD